MLLCGRDWNTSGWNLQRSNFKFKDNKSVPSEYSKHGSGREHTLSHVGISSRQDVRTTPSGRSFEMGVAPQGQ